MNNYLRDVGSSTYHFDKLHYHIMDVNHYSGGAAEIYNGDPVI